MMPPIRCITCGSVIGDKFEEYAEKVAAGKKPGAILDEMDIKRYCCRRMILSHLDFVDEMIAYKAR